MTETPAPSSVRAAVVQAAAVPFDSDACVARAVELIGQAAATGARLVVFPEAFIGGYPKGLNYGLVIGARDAAGREEFRRHLDSAITVPGPHTERLGKAAAAHGCHVVVVFCFRSAFVLGASGPSEFLRAITFISSRRIHRSRKLTTWCSRWSTGRFLFYQTISIRFLQSKQDIFC